MRYDLIFASLAAVTIAAPLNLAADTSYENYGKYDGYGAYSDYGTYGPGVDNAAAEMKTNMIPTRRMSTTANLPNADFLGKLKSNALITNMMDHDLEMTINHEKRHMFPMPMPKILDINGEEIQSQGTLASIPKRAMNMPDAKDMETQENRDKGLAYGYYNPYTSYGHYAPELEADVDEKRKEVGMGME